MLSGIEVMHVHAHGIFPRLDILIIMMAHRAERSSDMKAMRPGFQEFLLKLTSPKASRDH